MEAKKVFISYSWSNNNHSEWVLNLANRLMSDGVEVVLDKWDLKEGQDKYNFMERLVKSPDIDKVLIILDERYKLKADERTGGVGTETLIISAKMYNDVAQEKFIPVIAAVDEHSRPYIPVYLDGRVYIDLSKDEHFEQNYEVLLRNIYQRPAYVKPSLGKAPEYLFQDNPATSKTSILVRAFENQVANNPKRINSLIKGFFDEYYESLKTFSIKITSANPIEYGKEIFENLNQFIPLRNDFIDFVDIITKEEYSFDIEIFIKFLEKLPNLKYPLDDRSSWSNFEFDNFRFIINELFIYVVAIALKNESYFFLEEIFYSKYFTNDKYDYRDRISTFDKFYSGIDSISQYYTNLYGRQFYSPMADLLIKRLPEKIAKEIFVEADLLIHHIAKLNGLRWFPKTYVYDIKENYPLFERMRSLRHFEKVKRLFNVNSVDELKAKLLKLEESDNIIAYSGAFETVNPLFELININEVGAVR